MTASFSARWILANPKKPATSASVDEVDVADGEVVVDGGTGADIVEG